MGEGSDCPDIYLLCVEFSAEYFWGEVEGSSAEGVPELFGTMNRPAEVANFGHSLHHTLFTWQITMFSSLISRWMTSYLCM